MIYIIDRIRANGGEVIRTDWRFNLRPGRLDAKQIAWIKAHKDELYRDQWPEFDDWSALTAKLQAEGLPQEQADPEAYRRVMAC